MTENQDESPVADFMSLLFEKKPDAKDSSSSDALVLLSSSSSRRGDGPPRSIVSPDFPSEFEEVLFDKPLEAEAVAVWKWRQTSLRLP